MGRGRAKAKQTKVARELKYSSGNLDPDRLRAELAGTGGPVKAVEDGDVDPYADDEDEDSVAG